MIGGRSASLMINDLVDEPIDEKNPRTMDRPLPSGRITHIEAYILIGIASLILFYSAYRINITAFILSPVILIHAYIYPYFKKISSFSHLVLGINGSYAPMGGWIAIQAMDKDPVNYLSSLEYWPAMILSLALVFWYAGFDIIYSLQDIEFDREMNLKSVPAVYGKETSLKIAAMLHGFMVLFLFGLVAWMYQTELHWIYFLVGVVLSAILLIYEHLIAEHNIGRAFFTVNAVVSALLFFSLLASVLLG